MDDALLANNPKEQYLTLLESDIQDSKDKGKTISDTTVANSSDIKYQKVKGGGVCLCDSLLFCQRRQFLYPYL